MAERGSDLTRQNPSWEGLSEAAQAALARRPEAPSAASELLQPSPSTAIGADAEGWIRTELEGTNGGGALSRWRKLEGLLDAAVPADTDSFLEQGGMYLEAKLGKLARAKQALTESGEKTPSGRNVGETMHLVLIPWHVYKMKLEAAHTDDAWSRISFERWMYSLVQQRKDMDYGIEVDHASNRPNGSGMHTAFEQDYAIYRNPENPSEHLSFTNYLTGRMFEDGPWGIMLAQTGKNGVYVPPDGPRNADNYTAQGKENFQVAGYNVDALGILEWLSLVCQARKGAINSGPNDEYSLLLANRSRYHVGDIEEAVVAHYSLVHGKGKGYLNYVSTDGDGGFADRDVYGTILAVQ
ncbi:MAG TPA: hypothetical protein VD706_00520 [Candidatus Saccharimonadales bacterium]|nr:hypothetical protein [Candidatus Saccharimonadales bacterium]